MIDPVIPVGRAFTTRYCCTCDNTKVAATFDVCACHADNHQKVHSELSVHNGLRCSAGGRRRHACPRVRLCVCVYCCLRSALAAIVIARRWRALARGRARARAGDTLDGAVFGANLENNSFTINKHFARTHTHTHIRNTHTPNQKHMHRGVLECAGVCRCEWLHRECMQWQ